MELVAVAIFVIAAAVVGAVVVFWVLWRAMTALIEWLIYTFGNERAVEDQKRRRDRREPE